MYDFFGVEIRKCWVNENSHYYNFIDNRVIDLTRDQFGGIEPNYSEYGVSSKGKILNNNDTFHGYLLLKYNLGVINFDIRKIANEKFERS